MRKAEVLKRPQRRGSFIARPIVSLAPRARRFAPSSGAPGGSLLLLQHVSRAAHRMDEKAVGATIDRLAQAADVHVDQVALRIEVQVPDSLEQHGAGDHLSLAPHEELEQLLLAGGELDLPSAAGDLPGDQVELQVRDPQHRRLGGARAAPQQRLDAREELGEREGLREIVVAARLEAADAVIDRAKRTQNQYRSGEARAPQLLDDGQTVDVRQHPVGDDQVEFAGERAGEPLTAVRGVIDRITALAQSLHEDPRGLGIVLDEQNVHGAECTAEWFEALDPGLLPGPSTALGTQSPGAILDDAQHRPRRGEARDGPSNERGFCPKLRHLRRRGTSLCLVRQVATGAACCSTPCSRPMSVRRNTRLKRNWHEAETCSSSVELTLSTVTALAARMVAVRLAPGT